MFAKVIPFAKLPRRFDYFDYSVPKEFEDKIKTGHIVAIYFRGQKIYGAVEKISPETEVPAEKMKSISGLTEIILPENYLALISWAGARYLASPALFYKSFVPRQVRAREILDTPSSKNLLLGREQVANVSLVLKNFSGSGADNYFFYENSQKEMLAIFIKLAQKELQRKKQILFLVPASEDINDFAPYLYSVFGEKLVVWRGKLAAGEKFRLWRKIDSNNPLVIFGTRPAAFLPFNNLSLILIHNSSSDDLKQWDQNPRYDSRGVAEELSKIHRANLVFSDIFPGLNTWKKIQDKKITTLNTAEIEAPFAIVDVKKEKNTPVQIYTFPLHQMISRGLEKKEKIIIFLNRREKKSLLFCPDCRKVFSCPACSRPLNIDNGLFLCYYCGRKTDLPAACPDCRGTRLKNLSAGMENIKKIIAKEFPRAKIGVASKESPGPGNFDILLATDYFWKNISFKTDLSAIYGAAMADFDFYLIRPEFNQKETAMLALRRFLHFAASHNIQESLVQTAFPENKIFGDADKFYSQELDERQELGYPPFGQLVKIICKEKDPALLNDESRRLYEKLLNAGFNALPPFLPLVKKRTKNYLKHIILKESLDKDLSDLKNIVPDEYQVDVGPISIY